MPITIVLPSDCVVNLDGARRVDIRCVYGEVRLTIHTPPAPARIDLDDEGEDEPAPPVRRPAPAPIPEWDGPSTCRWVPAEYWQHSPSEDSGPTGIEPVDPFDPESEENDPWLRGR